MDFISKLFDTSDFPPRWQCGTWTDGHGWLHIISDLLTWASYTAIPIVLAVLMLRRKDLFSSPVFWLFSAFILACGTVHLVEALIFWFPIYRVSAVLKLMTAIVSVGTVFTLVRVVPSAIELPGLATINEQLRAEVAARKEAEQRLTLVLENLSEAVVFANPKGEFEIWNDAARDIIAERPRDLAPGEWSASYSVLDARDEKPMPTESLPLVRALGGEKCEDVPLILRSPSTSKRIRLMCQASPVRNDSGELLGAVLTARDMTEKHQAELEKERHYREIERVTGLASSVASAIDDIPTALNSRLVELALEVTNSPCGSLGLVHTDGSSNAITASSGLRDESLDWMTSELQQQSTELVLEEMVQHEGCVKNEPSKASLAELSMEHSVGVPLLVESETVGWLCVGNRATNYTSEDLGLLKRIMEIAGPVLLARQQLAERERELMGRQLEMERLARASTLGELTTTLAHELNQPMTTIANLAFACSNGLPDKPESETVKGTLTRIKDEALRAGKILRTIRELIQPTHESESREVVEMGLLIDRLLDLVSADADRAQVELAAVHPIDVFARVNSIRIQQVLLNLIRNSLDALEGKPNGKVSISCLRRNDEQIEVRVEDNGPGFADTESIFNAFYTTKKLGVGIGLKICRTIVEASGGRILASNGTAGGAVITFTLQSPGDGKSAELKP